MKRNPIVLLLVALALGWLFDFLFWKQAPGLNFALYAVLCIVGGLALLRLDGKPIARGAILLIPLVLFFALVTFTRAEPLTMAVAVILTLLLMTLLAIGYLDGAWLRSSLIQHVGRFFHLGLDMLVGPIAFRNELKREQSNNEPGPRRAGAWPVLRGALLAIPVLVIFAALLSSADVVFGDRVGQLVAALHLDSLPEYVFRLAYILIAAYALAGVYLHASGCGRTSKTASSGQTPSWSFLGFTEAGILLGSVIVLFAAFVLVQFRYFFGGQVNIGLEGYTYSEYARRGFGELLIVAIFSLLLLVGLSSVTRRSSRLQRGLFAGMSVAVVALVTVMLVSAYQRLSLYEAAYGFSRLRTYTNVLLVWIGLLLVAVSLLEALGLERYFTASSLIALIGFGASLSLINVDAFIVRQNADRALQGQALDVAYLASLSTDSVPALASAFQTAAYPASLHQALGAVLACRLALGPSSSDWRSFHLSRWQAGEIMQNLEAGLAGYRYMDRDWPPHVVAPSGDASYDCQASFGD